MKIGSPTLDECGSSGHEACLFTCLKRKPFMLEQRCGDHPASGWGMSSLFLLVCTCPEDVCVRANQMLFPLEWKYIMCKKDCGSDENV